MTDSRKSKTGLEWLLREADAKSAPAGQKKEPAAPGSVPAVSAPEPVANGGVQPQEAPVSRPSKIAATNGNRRTTARVKATFEVRYKKGSEQITSAGANLSQGGFFFETKKFLPLGDVFQAQLVFPAHGNRRMAVIAEVIHADDAGLGVKFLDVDDKDRPFLEELIAKG